LFSSDALSGLPEIRRTELWTGSFDAPGRSQPIIIHSMKSARLGRITAWSLLVLCLPVAAFDAFIVLGGFFTMSDAESAIPDNWAWFEVGPFSFMPALVFGILLALVFGGLESLNPRGRCVIWIPVFWLSYGACRFTWLTFRGHGFARMLDHGFYISLIAIPMLIAASCLWIVGILPTDGEQSIKSENS
jgi:hypothetical protein